MKTDKTPTSHRILPSCGEASNKQSATEYLKRQQVPWGETKQAQRRGGEGRLSNGQPSLMPPISGSSWQNRLWAPLTVSEGSAALDPAGTCLFAFTMRDAGALGA